MGLTYTLTLVQVTSETEKEFLERVQRVVDFSIQQSKSLRQPTAIEFDDPSKFRQIGESTYELIMPGDEE